MKKLFIILLIFSTKLNVQVVSKMIELGYDKETIKTYEKSSKPTFLIQLEGKENYESVGNRIPKFISYFLIIILL